MYRYCSLHCSFTEFKRNSTGDLRSPSISPPVIVNILKSLSAPWVEKHNSLENTSNEYGAPQHPMSGAHGVSASHKPMSGAHRLTRDRGRLGDVGLGDTGPGDVVTGCPGVTARPSACARWRVLSSLYEYFIRTL